MKGCLASVVMLMLPIALWWLPVPGLAGFIGGMVGGLIIGGAMRSFLFVLWPILFFSLLIAAVGFFTPLPLLGPLIAGLTFVWLLLTNLGLLLGALAGGVVYSLKTGESHRLLR